MQPVMVKTCRKVQVASMIASKHTADTITHKFYHLYQAAPEQKAPLQQILKIIIIFQNFSPFVMRWYKESVDLQLLVTFLGWRRQEC